MKKLLISLFLCFSSLALFAQNDMLFSQANEAYNKGTYDKAIELYETIEKSGQVSASLYFNLANSYYKLQKVAPSIYNYEKALALAPNDADIQSNYGFAKSARIDAIDELPQGFLKRTFNSLVSHSADFWAWLSIIFVFLFVGCFVVFYRSYASQQRKLFFAGWTLSLLLSVVSLVFAFQAASYKENNRYAVVFTPEVGIQSEPNLRSEKIFKLHEGTKVQVLQQVDDWKQIKLADGKTGWIPEKEIKEL